MLLEVIQSGECKILQPGQFKRQGGSGSSVKDGREGEGSLPEIGRKERRKEEKKARRAEREIKKREEERRKKHQEGVRHMQQEHADEVAILYQIHAQDWKNLQEENEKLMQEGHHGFLHR